MRGGAARDASRRTGEGSLCLWPVPVLCLCLVALAFSSFLCGRGAPCEAPLVAPHMSSSRALCASSETSHSQPALSTAVGLASSALWWPSSCGQRGRAAGRADARTKWCNSKRAPLGPGRQLRRRRVSGPTNGERASVEPACPSCELSARECALALAHPPRLPHACALHCPWRLPLCSTALRRSLLLLATPPAPRRLPSPPAQAQSPGKALAHAPRPHLDDDGHVRAKKVLVRRDLHKAARARTHARTPGRAHVSALTHAHCRGASAPRTQPAHAARSGSPPAAAALLLAERPAHPHTPAPPQPPAPRPCTTAAARCPARHPSPPRPGRCAAASPRL